MDEELKRQLKFLRFKYLFENWDHILKQAQKDNPSYFLFLKNIISGEYAHRRDSLKISRIKRANIKEVFIMETYPFEKQPQLKKKMILNLYDSLEFMQKRQELIFIGPTGCGKTGLATSFLTHAIDHDYSCYFIDFKDLIDQLYRSVADHTDGRVIKRFAAYDCLLIDELGYVSITKEQAGLFFDLMRKRQKSRTTLITTQLGFAEWNNFLQNTHLTAALIDRLTVHCTMFNLNKCTSLRPKNITQASTDKEIKSLPEKTK
ncbi:MAG: ATP-binding protein [Deltaproteobacteria bacterium]|nr:ATP-binding protein [Deltaproteobacteria bacterium]